MNKKRLKTGSLQDSDGIAAERGGFGTKHSFQ